jgi:hypothetical protein
VGEHDARAPELSPLRGPWIDKAGAISAPPR